jgi:hypothetical protein
MMKVPANGRGPIMAPVYPDRMSFRYNAIEMNPGYPTIQRAEYYRRDLGTDIIVYLCERIV